MDLREMGYDCNAAKEMLEALVNDEYCTYIVGKFENYEAILRALRKIFKSIVIHCLQATDCILFAIIWLVETII